MSAESDEVTIEHRNAAMHIDARMNAHDAAGHTDAQILDDMSDCALLMRHLMTTLSQAAITTLMRDLPGLHTFVRVIERRGKAIHARGSAPTLQ